MASCSCVSVDVAEWTEYRDKSDHKCGTCHHTESLWKCTTKGCDFIGCGRYIEQHALEHFQQTKHATAIELGSSQLYCYECDKEYDFQPTNAPFDVDTSFNWTVLAQIQAKERTGMQNLGNTCYLNSTIQVLAYVGSFLDANDELNLDSNIQTFRETAFLASGVPFHIPLVHEERQTRHRSASLRSENVMVFAHLRELIRLLTCTGGSISPLSFVSAVKQAMPFFRSYRQQDAQEFLRFFLDRIAFEQHQSVVELFRGSLKSTVTCLSCKTVREKIDPFLDLSLDIPIFRVCVRKNRLNRTYETRPLDLVDCLKSFTALEMLRSTELYYCTMCQSRERCSKKMEIQQLPQLLVLHLKRFRSGAHLSRRQRLKLRTAITFPLQGLNIQSFSTSDAEPATYDLRGIVCHHGSTVGCGHYSTYSLEESTGTWLRFNDSTVTVVSTQQVMNCEPYIMVYARSNC